MINREDMLALTRRMTVKRTSITRIAGSYMDEEGFSEGTFNTHFQNLSPAEREKNLALAKAVPFSETNKNLKEEIAKGRFREDLYHRLSVIIIEVPALKDRPEDIDELVTYFLETICNEMGIAQKNITPEALQALKSYEWTGNIRELRNVVERLIILGSPTITAEEVSMYK